MKLRQFVLVQNSESLKKVTSESTNIFDLVIYLQSLRNKLQMETHKKVTYNQLLEYANLPMVIKENDLSKLLPLTKFNSSLFPIFRQIKRHSILLELFRIRNKHEIDQSFFDNIDSLTVFQLRSKIEQHNDCVDKVLCMIKSTN